MSDVSETVEIVQTSSEYMEILTMIHTELLHQNEYLAGIYALGWVLCGVAVGCVTLYAFYKMITT